MLYKKTSLTNYFSLNSFQIFDYYILCIIYFKEKKMFYFIYHFQFMYNQFKTRVDVVWYTDVIAWPLTTIYLLQIFYLLSTHSIASKVLLFQFFNVYILFHTLSITIPCKTVSAILLMIVSGTPICCLVSWYGTNHEIFLFPECIHAGSTSWMLPTIKDGFLNVSRFLVHEINRF